MLVYFIIIIGLLSTHIISCNSMCGTKQILSIKPAGKAFPPQWLSTHSLTLKVIFSLVIPAFNISEYSIIIFHGSTEGFQVVKMSMCCCSTCMNMTTVNIHFLTKFSFFLTFEYYFNQFSFMNFDWCNGNSAFFKCFCFILIHILVIFCR